VGDVYDLLVGVLGVRSYQLRSPMSLHPPIRVNVYDGRCSGGLLRRDMGARRGLHMSSPYPRKIGLNRALKRFAVQMNHVVS